MVEYSLKSCLCYFAVGPNSTRDFDLTGYLEHGSITRHKHLTKIGVKFYSFILWKQVNVNFLFFLLLS